MATTTLNAYLHTIEELLAAGQLAQAEAHCRHVLQQKPLAVAAYRLLGEVQIAQQEWTAARETLGRVLSADPDDQAAHQRLLVVETALNDEARAAWHRERLHALDPYADRSVPPTPEGVARLYVRGELFDLAERALSDLLADAPTRTDIQLLLAQVWWESGQRAEAIAAAQAVLRQLPYSRGAHTLLAEAWLLAGLSAEAQPHLDVIRALDQPTSDRLDPNSAEARLFAFANAPTLPQHITVSVLQSSDGMEEQQMSDQDKQDKHSQDVPDVPNEEAPDDLDAAMAWLEQLAAKQGAPVEELPSMHDKDPDDLNEAELPDWLKNLPESSEDPPEESLDDLDLPLDDAVPEEDLPDWLKVNQQKAAEAAEASDDGPSAESEVGLDWLDELTTGTETEELPTMQWEGPEGEPADADELIDEALGTAADDLAEELEVEMSEPDSVVDDAIVAAEIALENEKVEEPDEIEDAMAWLEQLAAGEGEAIDEMPTMVSPSREPEDPIDIEPEELLAASIIEAELSADLAAQERGEDLVEESEALDDAIDESLDDLLGDTLLDGDDTLIEGEAVGISASAEASDPQDFDDAMDWLEQLAADQTDPLEELPSVADRVLASSVMAEAAEQAQSAPTPQLNVKQAAALAYFEDLARADGVDLDSLTLKPVEAFADLDDLLTVVDSLARGDSDGVDTAVGDMDWNELSNEMPDDPDDALAWLERLAAEASLSDQELVAPDDSLVSGEVSIDVEETVIDELLFDEETGETILRETTIDEVEVVVEPPTLPGEQTIDEAAISAETEDVTEADFLSEMPEDPDEAMAWLEKLAARQGAPIDELPSVDEVPDDVEMPDWLKAEVENAEAAESSVELDAALEADDEDESTLGRAGRAAAAAVGAAAVAALTGDDEDEEDDSAEETVADDTAVVEEAAVEEVVAELEAEAELEEALETAELEAALEAEVEAVEAETEAEMEAIEDAVETRFEEIEVELEAEAAEEAEEADGLLDDALAAAAVTGAVHAATSDEVDADVEEIDEPADDPVEVMVEEAIEAEVASAEGDADVIVVDSVEEALTAVIVDDLLLAATGDTDLEAEVAAEMEAEAEMEAVEEVVEEAEEEVDSAVDESLAWIDDLQKPPVDDWLDSEEEAHKSGLYDTQIAPQPTNEMSTLPEAQLPEPPEVVPPPAVEPPSSALEIDESERGQARARLDAGEIEEAIPLYQALIDEGEGMPVIISDLEEAADAHGSTPGLRRLLGDAYMRNGQLQKALEAYRQALDNL